MGIIPGKCYRIKYDNPALNIKAGEIGIAVENNYPKYDALLDLGSVKVEKSDLPSFLSRLKNIRRVYYFYACELEEV